MRSGRDKVFCIGLPRTGTSSFRVACEKIGMRVMNSPLDADLIESLQTTGRLPDNRYDENDVFADVLISAWWVELSRSYPHARFVLTTRRPFDWVDSMKARFAEPQADLAGARFPLDRAAGHVAYAISLGTGVCASAAIQHEQEVRSQFDGCALRIIPLHAVDRMDMTATMCAITGAYRTHSTPCLDPWPYVNRRDDV